MDSFLENKYTKWYFAIITHACKNVNIGDVEKHHIIPKSLGGSNDQSNIIKLSYRQHFICHLLLTKMTIGEARKKMVYAFWMLRLSKKNPARTKIVLCKNSKWYASVKRQKSGQNCYMTGIPKSKEIRDKISLTLKGRKVSVEVIAKIKSTISTPEFKAKRYDEKWSATSSAMQKGVRLCSWTLRDPLGEDHEVNDLQAFCQSHELKYETLRGTLRRKKPVTFGKCAGWMIVQKVDWRVSSKP